MTDKGSHDLEEIIANLKNRIKDLEVINDLIYLILRYKLRAETNFRHPNLTPIILSFTHTHT